MTMQTPQPLVHTTLSATHRPVEWFHSLSQRTDGGLDMDQPYQRGDVWGVTRRRNLIRSLLLGVPIPSVVINDRMGAKFRGPGYDQGRNWAYSIVDGKQRVTTFLMWFNGLLAVPASWFSPDLVEMTEDTEDGPYVRFYGLTERGRRKFMNFGISVVEGRLRSLDEEKAIFDLINFGGVAQGSQDEDA